MPGIGGTEFGEVLGKMVMEPGADRQEPMVTTGAGGICTGGCWILTEAGGWVDEGAVAGWK